MWNDIVLTTFGTECFKRMEEKPLAFIQKHYLANCSLKYYD